MTTGFLQDSDSKAITDWFINYQVMLWMQSYEDTLRHRGAEGGRRGRF